MDHRGATLQAERIALDAQSFDNRAGKVIATGAEGSRIEVAGTLDNGEGGLLASNGDLGIQAAVFGNAGGGVQHAGEGVLSISAGALNGTGGTLVSNGSLLLRAPPPTCGRVSPRPSGSRWTPAPWSPPAAR